MKDDVTLAGAARRSPVRVALFSVLPVVLAAAQLVNGAVTRLDPWVSVGFAVVMGCYAVVATRYLLAQDRLRVLESSGAHATAD